MAARRVLMLAYFFPPLGGAGVQRTLKFVRYLEPLGWHATVITCRPGDYPVEDRSLLGEVPATTTVVRVRAFPLRRWAATALRVARLRRLADLLAWPDGGLGWALPAAWRAWRAVRAGEVDVLYSTSAPYGAHLAAALVHRLTGVPWVADFRDEWAANPHQLDAPAPVRALSRRAEAAVVGAADEVVVVADYFDLAGPERPRTEIPNGVDPHDVPPAAPRAGGRAAMRLSFVGTLYAEQDCRPVLDALARLRADGRLPGDRVEFRVVGNVWLADEDAAALPPDTVRTGYVEHHQALEEMRAADVLLFYVAPSSRAPSGKLYEYLASERPILCVAREDNPAFGLVRAWEAGLAVVPGDAAGLEAALLELHGRFERGALADQPGRRERTYERFSRERLTAQLAAVLERAAARP